MSRKFPNKKITVVMPAYKAEKTLARTIDAIPRECVDELILVDDASPDATVDVAKKLGIDIVIRHPKNRGYGGNQKTCYQTAISRGADIVVMVHPDYQYDPAFIPKLCEPLANGESDAVFGSRMLNPHGALDGGMPYWKFIANIVLTRIENIILGLKLSEYHSGFRAYSRKTLQTVPFTQNSDDFIFDSEIIVQMRIANLRIKEIPISTRYFPEASMISFSRSCRYGIAILGLLVQYILFRIGIFSCARFIMLSDVFAMCPICASIAPQLDCGLKNTNVTVNDYTITEHSKGLVQTLHHCQTCDVFFMPNTDGKKSQKMYVDQNVDFSYLAEEKGRRKTARSILKRLRALVPFGGTLIDIGCSYGFFLDEAEHYGWKASGMELGDAPVRYARSIGLEVRQSSWSALSEYPDASIDVITAFDVIEHLENPGDFIKLISSKLKPDGYMILTTPNRSSFFARLVGGKWHAFLPSHLFYFSDKSINFILSQNNLVPTIFRSHRSYFSLNYIFSRAGDYGFSSILQKVLGSFLHSIIVPINLHDEFEIYAQKRAISSQEQ